MIGAITGLLACQLAGELLARSLQLPVPGPVIGMVLLFCWLLLHHGSPGDASDDPSGEVPEALGRVTDALLNNLGLLFVPAGVGVVAYGSLLARDWAPIALAVGIGTPISIAATGRLAQVLLRRMS